MTTPDDEHRERRRRGFDPDDAFRVMNDIQQLGFDAAGAVIDRFTEMVAGSMPRQDPQRSGSVGFSPRRDAARDVWDDASRLFDAYLDMLQSSWKALSRVVEGTGLRGRPHSEEHVDLPAAAPGERSRATLWIHNSTGDAAGPIDVRAGELVAADGGVIPARAVALEPNRTEVIPAASSAAVEIAVDVPDDAAPAEYHGIVVAGTEPVTRLTLALRVRGER